MRPKLKPMRRNIITDLQMSEFRVEDRTVDAHVALL
jgi:hypothetical protein